MLSKRRSPGVREQTEKGNMSRVGILCPRLIRRFYGYPLHLSVTCTDIEGGVLHANSCDTAMIVLISSVVMQGRHRNPWTAPFYVRKYDQQLPVPIAALSCGPFESCERLGEPLYAAERASPDSVK